MSGLLAHSGNLLQNASFETDLAFWQAYNVTTTDSSAAEGSQAARLGQNVASLYQDVPLGCFLGKPLFLSFIVYATESRPGDLIVEVLWLNAIGSVIGTGLRALLLSDSISSFRNTFFDVTDRPPLGAIRARLKFSKDASDIPLLIDLVNLVPVETKNLINNPSFESGLSGWNAVNFDIEFAVIWEGSAALRETTFPGTLTQEVDLNPLRLGSAYLLSLAAEATSLLQVAITVRLIWLNALGVSIGTPGIDAAIFPLTTSGRGKYLNYVLLSGPAPIGAVRARLEITANGSTGAGIALDQVILLRLASPNLIRNSGFDNGHDFWTGTNFGVSSGGGYVSQFSAFLGATGGLISQTVALPICPAGHNFLLNFALHYNGIGNANGHVIAQVTWLDTGGNEIGLGLRLIVLQPVQPTPQWQVYTGVTEPVPFGAASAMIRFTKSFGDKDSVIGLDSVIFARID